MIFAGASTDEKLLKDIGNYRTEVRKINFFSEIIIII